MHDTCEECTLPTDIVTYYGGHGINEGFVSYMKVVSFLFRVHTMDGM